MSATEMDIWVVAGNQNKVDAIKEWSVTCITDAIKTK